MAKRVDLLKAIYSAVQWDKLYQALPDVTRQQVDEFFRELRQGLPADVDSPVARLPADADSPLAGLPTCPSEADTSHEANISEELAAQLAGGEVWVYCDGASRGNPGPAGIGVVLTTPAGAQLLAWGSSIGRATSNVAEYRAVIEGLKKARELNVKRVRILSDSELLVRQLEGAYKVKSTALKPLHAQAAELLRAFEQWSATRLTRQENAKADALAAQHARAAANLADKRTRDETGNSQP